MYICSRSAVACARARASSAHSPRHTEQQPMYRMQRRRESRRQATAAETTATSCTTSAIILPCVPQNATAIHAKYELRIYGHAVSTNIGNLINKQIAKYMHLIDDICCTMASHIARARQMCVITAPFAGNSGHDCCKATATQ